MFNLSHHQHLTTRKHNSEYYESYHTSPLNESISIMQQSTQRHAALHLCRIPTHHRLNCGVGILSGNCAETLFVIGLFSLNVSKNINIQIINRTLSKVDDIISVSTTSNI